MLSGGDLCLVCADRVWCVCISGYITVLYCNMVLWSCDITLLYCDMTLWSCNMTVLYCNMVLRSCDIQIYAISYGHVNSIQSVFVGDQFTSEAEQVREGGRATI